LKDPWEAQSLRERVNFYVLLLSMVSLWITSSTIYMVLPIYFKDAGLSASDIGLLIALGTLPGSFSAFIAGWLSDKIGRKPILILGLFLYSSCFLLFYFFKGFWFFALTRFIEGVSYYVIPPVATAIISDLFPPEGRGQAVGLYQSAGSVGRVVGPLIAGALLASSTSFSSYFLFCSLSVFVGAVSATLLVRETLSREQVQQAGRSLRGRGLRSSLSSIERPLVAFYTASFVQSLGRTGVSPLISVFLQERIVGIGWMEMSLLFSIPQFIPLVLSPIAGRLSDRIGRKRLLIGSIIGLSTVMILYPNCRTFDVALILRGAEACFNSFTMTLSTAYIADLLTALGHGRRSGMGLGIHQFLTIETSTFGTIYGGYAVDIFGFNTLFQIAAILLVSGSLLLTRVPEPRSLRTEAKIEK
jgi:DHA1 family multidrug resistance protein-like MFS transporter